LFHEIYLNHYHTPYPFTNKWLKDVVSQSNHLMQSSIEIKAPMHNSQKMEVDGNMIAMYFYLLFKKTDKIDLMKSEDGRNWITNLANDVYTGIYEDPSKTENLELYETFLQKVEPKSKIKIETVKKYFQH